MDSKNSIEINHWNQRKSSFGISEEASTEHSPGCIISILAQRTENYSGANWKDQSSNFSWQSWTHLELSEPLAIYCIHPKLGKQNQFGILSNETEGYTIYMYYYDNNEG